PPGGSAPRGRWKLANPTRRDRARKRTAKLCCRFVMLLDIFWPALRQEGITVHFLRFRRENLSARRAEPPPAGDPETAWSGGPLLLTHRMFARCQDFIEPADRCGGCPRGRPGSNQGNTCACAIRRRKALGSKEIGQNWPPADHPKVLPENGPF